MAGHRLSASSACLSKPCSELSASKPILHVMKSNLEFAPSAVSSMETDHVSSQIHVAYQGEAVGSSNAFLSVPLASSQAVNLT